MMNSSNIYKVIKDLSKYIENENFKGWDPYDYLSSWFPFRWFGKMAQAVAVQAGKLMPINLRPILGIKKSYNPKGLSLILQSYCILYKETKEETYLQAAHKLFRQIMSMKNDSDYLCWGYNFTWANPHHVHPPFTPSVVVEAFVGFGIFSYYEMTGSEEAKSALIKMTDFIHDCLIWTKTESGLSVSYTKEEKSYCYNASILGASILARIYSITKDVRLKDEIQGLTSFVLAHQKEDGHWEYSFNLETGKEYSQIDFHQGFIIDALADVDKYCPLDISNEIKTAISKGMYYYRNVQFNNDGISLWRVPKRYPVEIHNQAQGIITLSKLASEDNDFLEFANTIAQWTVKNMKSPMGFFYYRKYRYYTIRIPYMRWSQAWMLLALCTLRKSIEKSISRSSTLG